jgi:hypothetical protein
MQLIIAFLAEKEWNQIVQEKFLEAKSNKFNKGSLIDN